MRWRGTGRTTFEHQRKWMESAAVVNPYATFRSRTGCSPVEATEKDTRLLSFHALDVRAEFLQFFVKVFVASVDVIHAADFRDAICF